MKYRVFNLYTRRDFFVNRVNKVNSFINDINIINIKFVNIINNFVKKSSNLIIICHLI